MLKLCFYVPAEQLEAVKSAVFDTGAGRSEYYQRVCWQTAGTGQFEALSGSNPDRGRHGELCQVSEYKVEMICQENLIDTAVAALKAAHPYEQVAYDVVQLLDK